ncbi:50S ribosomal protein L24 [Chitinispirillales bacterium ANBcel5]|uniref:50S ribosomal protein L24 n=1 Tax=Cellulosispirillum alkaliphilum TaxID=3039283 RepID=UPI002A53B800|nr:50S ribosomal protein L24 [Chitinispirillales bacterium ANBcel5]
MSLGLKKNDEVQVMAGEHRGKTGRIIKVIPEKNRAIVEGINIVKRHTKPSPKNQQGGIMEKEASVHLSNLMLKCPKSGQPTRLGVKVLENGQRLRFSKKAKESIE